MLSTVQHPGMASPFTLVESITKDVSAVRPVTAPQGVEASATYHQIDGSGGAWHITYTTTDSKVGTAIIAGIPRTDTTYIAGLLTGLCGKTSAGNVHIHVTDSHVYVQSAGDHVGAPR